MAVFFDIEKTYDTTRRYRISCQLYDWDMRGSLPIFIQEFLSYRNFKVQIGNIYSNPQTQKECVP